ncbi:MAG TPA: hypothetical protein VMX12_06705 [Acidimicrobiia bacterium]|nr:hypothetical protein [Acidimicrobiia bacterium]
MKDRREDRLRLREANATKRKLDHLNDRLTQARIATENKDHPLWTVVLRPLLEGYIRNFDEVARCASTDGETFKREQAKLFVAQDILELFDTALIDTTDVIEGQIREAIDALERLTGTTYVDSDFGGGQ